MRDSQLGHKNGGMVEESFFCQFCCYWVVLSLPSRSIRPNCRWQIWPVRRSIDRRPW